MKALTPAGMSDFLAGRCNNLSGSIAGRFRVWRGLSIASLHRLMCNPLFGLPQTELLPLAAGQGLDQKTRAVFFSSCELSHFGNQVVVLQGAMIPHSELFCSPARPKV